jgi:hypothetical protein
VKVSAAANLDWILKNWRVWEAHQKTHLQFFNEIYWAQKLAEADLGPNFFGVTFMEINEESSGVQIKEKPFALISSYIEGKTYKVPHGILVPPNASKEHKEAIEALVPKLNNFIKDNHAAVIDLQYMVDQNNRAWVIDPEQWSLNI